MSRRVDRLSLGKKILFSLLPAIVLLAGCEIGLRLLGIPEEKYLIRRFAFPPPDLMGVAFEHDDDLFWRLVPGYDGPWTMYKTVWTHEARRRIRVNRAARKAALPDREYFAGVTWGVNADGHRGPRVAGDRPCILVMGSSITFGWGVKSEDTFAGVLRRRLREGGYDDWQVLNAGVPGYTSYQSFISLRRLAANHRVRVIVFEAGVNDGMLAPARRDRDMAVLERAGTPSRFWMQWNLILWLHFAYRDWRAGSPDRLPSATERYYASSVHRPGHSRVPPDEFAANFQAVNDLARERGAVAYFFIPGLYNEYGRWRLLESARWSDPAEIPVVRELRKLTADELAEMFLPYDEAHLSPKGHRFVADLIWNRLQRDGVLASPSAGPPATEPSRGP